MLRIVVEDSNINALNVISSGFRLNLLDGDKVVGRALLNFNDCFYLTEFEVQSGDQMYTDFFFRGILFKLGSTKQKLRIKKDKRLYKYGFNDSDDYMELECDKAQYPSDCKH